MKQSTPATAIILQQTNSFSFFKYPSETNIPPCTHVGSQKVQPDECVLSIASGLVAYPSGMQLAPIYEFRAKDCYCQACGAPIQSEHRCGGTWISLGDSDVQSIPATDELKRWLLKKGFHETLGPYCIYYYHHPMYGLLFLYPGVFTGTVNTDGRALLEHLRSLPDSSYTDFASNPADPASRARCNACGAVGPIFPDEHDPFPHLPSCPQHYR
jgi:hypothetical protein